MESQQPALRAFTAVAVQLLISSSARRFVTGRQASLASSEPVQDTPFVVLDALYACFCFCFFSLLDLTLSLL